MFDDLLKNIGLTAVAIPISVLGLSMADVPPEYVEMAAESVRTNVAVIVEYKDQPIEHKPYEIMSNYEKAKGQTDLAVLQSLATSEAQKIINTGDTDAYEEALDKDPLIGRITPSY